MCSSTELTPGEGTNLIALSAVRSRSQGFTAEAAQPAAERARKASAASLVSRRAPRSGSRSCHIGTRLLDPSLEVLRLPGIESGVNVQQASVTPDDESRGHGRHLEGFRGLALRIEG